MKLEELLNKLIEKGWRPFDVKWISEYFFESVPVGLYRLCWKKPDYDYNVYSKRDLVSKESGLWQFCCDNGLIKGNTKEAYYWQYKTPLWAEWAKTYRKADYQYRLIESALKDESELEDFLLSNIVIKENENWTR